MRGCATSYFLPAFQHEYIFKRRKRADTTAKTYSPDRTYNPFDYETKTTDSFESFVKLH